MHQQHGRYWCKYHSDYSTEQWRPLLQMVQESSTQSLDKVLYMVCIRILLEAVEKETLSSHSTGNRCNNCIGCSQTTDCGKCKFCMDKPKFGGPGTLKQRCLKRKCQKLVQTAVATTTAVAVDHKVCAANVSCTTYIYVCIPNNIPLVNVWARHCNNYHFSPRDRTQYWQLYLQCIYYSLSGGNLVMHRRPRYKLMKVMYSNLVML